MPRQIDERPRVLGPSYITGRGQWRLLVIHTPTAPQQKDRQSAFHYRTEDEANEAKRKIEEKLCTITVGMAIDAYEEYLKAKETNGYEETVRRIRLFFPDHEMLLTRVTEEKGREWYDAFRARKIEHYKKDGTPAKDHGRAISASYHRATLINARSMMKYAQKFKKWIRENPFRDIEGLGKRKSGKRKPTGNDLRAWYRYTMSRVVAGDKTALGLMMAFSMALRSADLCRRLVRDVDLDCTQLNIDSGKTEKSNEPRIIPVKLQPYLRQLIENRDAFEPLFKTPYTENGHHTRRWLEEAQDTFCKNAGVPYFCPHTLKGVAGTVLAKRGAAANVIMDHLSHEEDATTFRHYVEKGVVNAKQAAVVFELFSEEEN